MLTDFFNQCGNFLFHTRNYLFPVLMLLLFFLWPPVALNSAQSVFLMVTGIILILLGQIIRIVTIGLAYIIRGGRLRRIYAEKLVTDGMFSHCRNPLYVGNILFVIGFLFVAGNISGIIVGSILFLIIYRLIVHSEETFLGNMFGQAYADFCRDVPRWLPKLEGMKETIADYEFDWPGVVVKEYGTIFKSVMLPLVVIAWKLYIAGQLGNYGTTLILITLLSASAFGYARYLKKSQKLQSLR